PELVAGATLEQRQRVWRQLVEFGALDAAIGAVEACLIARSLGLHLAPVPFLSTSAIRLALGPDNDAEGAVALAILEPGSSWPDAEADVTTALHRSGTTTKLHGEKVAVEQLDLAERVAVLA